MMSGSQRTVESLRISGKNLGVLAMPTVCLRCFWLKLHLGFRLPFSVFPGIFSTIDAFTKQVVHGHFDQHGGPPPWLAGLGDLVSYIEPPSYARFNFMHEPTGILITGAPDGLLVHRDGTLVICDYKTARYTQTQDALFPMYEVQLNAYALIAEQCGFGRIGALALVYFEPVTGPQAARRQSGCNHGFDLGFHAHVVRVERQPDLVESLLVQTRWIWEAPCPPSMAPADPPGDRRRAGCQDCAGIDRLVSLVPENRLVDSNVQSLKDLRSKSTLTDCDEKLF